VQLQSHRSEMGGGDHGPQEAAPGSMFVAPRGHRHGFSNPSGEQARVLGLWAPPEPALAFMRDIGATLPPGRRAGVKLARTRPLMFVPGECELTGSSGAGPCGWPGRSRNSV